MHIIVSNHPSSTDSARRVPNRGCKFSALLMLLAFAVSPPLTFCQSPPSSQPSPSQPPQSQPQPKDDSNTDAPKKTEKDKPKPKKVYTEADLSNLHGGVSVVGDSNSAASNSNSATSAAARPAGGKAGAGVVPMSGQDENYWRGRAKEILDEMAAIDQEIAKTKEDIKKYGADGFDAQSGLKDNIIYIDNRASKVQQLEKRKSELAKKLDQLQEDARKAGAPPEWLR
jgi:hypothetical protein